MGVLWSCLAAGGMAIKAEAGGLASANVFRGGALSPPALLCDRSSGHSRPLPDFQDSVDHRMITFRKDLNKSEAYDFPSRTCRSPRMMPASWYPR